jgi:hypothetical protein
MKLREVGESFIPRSLMTCTNRQVQLDQVKKDETGRACSKYAGEQERI